MAVGGTTVAVAAPVAPRYAAVTAAASRDFPTPGAPCSRTAAGAGPGRVSRESRCAISSSRPMSSAGEGDENEEGGGVGVGGGDGGRDGDGTGAFGKGKGCSAEWDPGGRRREGIS